MGPRHAGSEDTEAPGGGVSVGSPPTPRPSSLGGGGARTSDVRFREGVRNKRGQKSARVSAGPKRAEGFEGGRKPVERTRDLRAAEVGLRATVRIGIQHM